MKIKITFLTYLFTFYSFSQIGIGTVSPDSSAQLDVFSTTSGFLIPRMTASQRTAISNPSIGLMLYCIDCGNQGEHQFYNGSTWVNMIGETASLALWSLNYVHCNSSPTIIVDVTNPITGKTWMDRNLGANRAAISSTDTQAYGSLFQWGRGADGHQCINRYLGDGVTTSTTTTTLSNLDIPGHGNYITINTGLIDWRSPQNTNLWQGSNGINNPCPNGYRVPTAIELNSEISSWTNNNALGAFSSTLKLPLVGRRNFIDGSLADVGTHGNYWTNTAGGTSSQRLRFHSSAVEMFNNVRANGYAVRCIKD